jgi:hypothetical protein
MHLVSLLPRRFCCVRIVKIDKTVAAIHQRGSDVPSTHGLDSAGGECTIESVRLN